MTAQPLTGLRVLDFSTLLPGPYATLQLADLGAEVLRVESPTRPDLVRELEPRFQGQSAAFQYLNRGKRSLALNLKHPEAAAIVRRLVAEYDILVEQFRPGVMRRLGLDYDRLAAHNPALIYCSLTGYGQTGDYALRAGHDINYLALSGIAGYGGRALDGPSLAGVQLADLAAGAQNATIAILAAVIERQRSGLGQWLDIAMADGCLALNALFGPGALSAGEALAPEDNLLNGGGLYDYYRTGDGRYLAVGSLEPRFRRRLCDTLGYPEWAALPDHELKPLLADLFEERPQAHWIARFDGVDACVEPVLGFDELERHPLVRSRGLVEEVRQAGRVLKRPASPFVFDGRRPASGALAPACGEHSRSLLETLGYSDSDLQQLEKTGLFGEGPGLQE